MKHKTTELKGDLLDLAAAKALGSDGSPAWWPDFSTGPMENQFMGDPFTPSTRWDHGGPIIAREKIALYAYGESWCAVHPRPGDGASTGYMDIEQGIIDCRWDEITGETPLVAAMRAYVESKFGKEVELP